MELFKLPGFIIALLCLMVRPITVFFHEMGHAGVGWWATGKRINIFIGSFGDKEGSFTMNVKDFSFYFSKNPLKWTKGLCKTEEIDFSINKQIFFVLGGPAVSLFIAGISYLIISITDFWEVFFAVLMISSVFDFLVNIIPSKNTFYLSDGRQGFNDGKHILNLLKIKKLPKEYSDGMSRFRRKQYQEAVSVFDNLLKDSKEPEVYRMAIASHIYCRNYKEAKEIASEFKNSKFMNADDWTNFALTLTENGELTESLVYYDKALKVNPKNKFALNNKGYTLILLEKYEESLPLLTQAISLDKSFSYAYNNRGLAKINMDFFEEGLKDIEEALQLDPQSSDTFKNLGIYYLKKADYNKALDQFLKAKELDSFTPKIDEFICEAKSKISDKTVF